MFPGNAIHHLNALLLPNFNPRFWSAMGWLCYYSELGKFSLLKVNKQNYSDFFTCVWKLYTPNFNGQEEGNRQKLQEASSIYFRPLNREKKIVPAFSSVPSTEIQVLIAVEFRLFLLFSHFAAAHGQMCIKNKKCSFHIEAVKNP